MRVLVIDNYDSFTYNLVQYLGELGAELEVVRNDVAVTSELLDLDASELADRAEVVTAEIDQHHVLRALLLVPLQLLAKTEVVFLVAASRPGAGNRVGLDVPSFHSHEHLG